MENLWKIFINVSYSILQLLGRRESAHTPERCFRSLELMRTYMGVGKHFPVLLRGLSIVGTTVITNPTAFIAVSTGNNEKMGA